MKIRLWQNVCGDDMLHLCIDMKPHCRIFAGNVRVCKAVEHTLVHMVVPVVQVEIMEQCPEDQIFIIYMDMQTNGNDTADPHYRKAVLQCAGRSVLNILVHGADRIVLQIFLHFCLCQFQCFFFL